MTEIKTYNRLNKQNTSAIFEISTMEDINRKKDGKNDVPHRHNYFTVLLVKKAKGKHFIDFKEHELTDNQVFFISPGQVHQIIENEISVGFCILFSDRFMAKNNFQSSFMDKLDLFNDHGETLPLSLSSMELDELNQYANEIHGIYNSDISFKYEAIGALLKLIFIKCHNFHSYKADIPQILKSKNSILVNFKNLISENYANWHTTGNYANQLNITSGHLNKVTKSSTGKTATEHIQDKIIMEAKRLLYFTDLSNKEIAYQLGFYEPANFSAFFKKHTLLSPTKFREST